MDVDPHTDDVTHWAFDLARYGRSEELAAYVDAGVPVDLTDAAGNTLLMLAAYYGHATSVRALIARGANPDRTNDRGQTPLAGAVFKRSPDVVAVLLDAGADPQLGTPSALESARFFGQDDMTALLVQGG